jgi:hypothetical protein
LLERSTHACGPNGLAAIDRVEQCAYWSMVASCAVTTSSMSLFANSPFLVCSRAYSNVVYWQVQGDPEVAALWRLVGRACDWVAQLWPREVEHITYDARTVTNSSLWANKRAIILSQYRSYDGAQQALRYVRLGTAYTHLKDVYNTYKKLFGSEGARIVAVVQDRLAEVQFALAYAMLVVEFQSESLNEHHEAVRSIWGLAIDTMQAAITTLKDEATAHHSGSLSPSHLPSRRVACSASALAKLVRLISPVARQLSSVKASAASLPRQWVEETDAMLVSLLRDVRTSQLAQRPAGEGGQAEEQRLEEAVSALADRVERAARSNTAQHQCIQRCLLSAKRFDVAVSAAHPKIAECWLQAAHHMQHALDVEAASGPSEVRSREVARHTELSLAYEQLATGVFEKAATCFTRAESVLLQSAKELLLDAAELLMQAGTERLQSLACTGSAQPPAASPLGSLSSVGEARLRCAEMCAETAQLLEANETRWGADDAERALRLVFVDVERAAVVCAVWGDTAVHQRVLRLLRALLADTLILLQTTTLRFQAEDPTVLARELALLLSPSASNSEDAVTEAVEWLGAIAVECGRLFVQLVQDRCAAMGGIPALLKAVCAASELCDYACDTAAPPTYQSAPLSALQRSRIRVATLRFLEAARVHLQGQRLSGELWHRAGDVEMSNREHNLPAVAPLYSAVGNAIAVCAVQHTSAIESPLCSSPPDALLVGGAHCEGQEQAVGLIVTAAQRACDHGLLSADAESDRLAGLHWSAREQFRFVVDYSLLQLAATQTGQSSAVDFAATAVRASRSAEHYRQAAEAFDPNKKTADFLHKMAGKHWAAYPLAITRKLTSKAIKAAEKAARKYEEVIEADNKKVHREYLRLLSDASHCGEAADDIFDALKLFA